LWHSFSEILSVPNALFFSSSVHTPGAYSLDGSGALGLSEKTFLSTNKHSQESEVETASVPSLDDFDKELEIFRVSYNNYIFSKS
jgi:hypothetical protein